MNPQTDSVTPVIRLTNVAHDVTPEGREIFRGRIHPDSLEDLLVDDYQREPQSTKKLKELIDDTRAGKIPPDIELGTRGITYQWVDEHTVDFFDPTYIVDGLQRVTAARYRLIQGDEPSTIHQGAIVFTNTDNQWERDRFELLNTRQLKVSPDVLLHNLMPKYPVVELLHRITTGNGSFVMQGRVKWRQNMRDQELITAMTLFKVTASLMAHQGALQGTDYETLARGLQRVYDAVGKTTFQRNIEAFFDAIETAWGLKTIKKRDSVPYIRLTFMESLATLFSRHLDFWDSRNSNRLFINAPDMRKLRQFEPYDPTVANLSGSAGQARTMLYVMMEEHMNKSRRTGFIQKRTVTPQDLDSKTRAKSSDEDEDEQTAAEAGLDPAILEQAQLVHS